MLPHLPSYPSPAQFLKFVGVQHILGEQGSDEARWTGDPSAQAEPHDLSSNPGFVTSKQCDHGRNT